MKKLMLTIWTVVLLLLPVLVQAAPQISAAGAFVMDGQTGAAIYTAAPDVRRPPASMTKMMGLLLVYEALERGELTEDQMLTVSPAVIAQIEDYQYAAVPFTLGQQISVRDLMHLMLVKSSNEAPVILGEALAPSQEGFTAMMNARADEMGIDAHFVDASGWDDASWMTPRAAATLARHLITNYPQILTISQKPSFTFQDVTYQATNKLLKQRAYFGVDGLKTGTTNGALNCICATAQRGGLRTIAVVMGAPTDVARYTDAHTLLDYAFFDMDLRYHYLLGGDVRTVVNGSEVPTFYYGGLRQQSVVVLEDLQNYGFDLTKDGETWVLTYNPQKAVTPMSMDGFRQIPVAQACYTIEGTDVPVRIVVGDQTYEAKDTFALGGYTAVSVDEFRTVGGFYWNFAEKTVRLEIAEPTTEPEAMEETTEEPALAA